VGVGGEAGRDGDGGAGADGGSDAGEGDEAQLAIIRDKLKIKNANTDISLRLLKNILSVFVYLLLPFYAALPSAFNPIILVSNKCSNKI